MKKQKTTLRTKGLELINLWRADWNRFVREAFGVTLDPDAARNSVKRSAQQAHVRCVRNGTGKGFRCRLCGSLFLVSDPTLETK